jgi:hypothetical protein
MTRSSWVLVVGILALSYGGCVVPNSYAVRELAERVPRMTCDELVRNGPGPNEYVTLTDVRLCRGGYVFRRDSFNGSLDELVQPVYSARLARPPEPQELALLLRITDDQEKDELIGQPGTVEFTCAVSKGVRKVDAGIARALEDKYPSIQLARCWLLTVGNLEPTAARPIACCGTASWLLCWAAVWC